MNLFCCNRAIVTPMKRRLSIVNKLCGVIFAWVIAIGISVPYILTQSHFYYRGEYFCLEDGTVMTQKQKDFYVISLAVIGWIIPISIISVHYGLCIRMLRKNSFNNDNNNNNTMKRRIIENKKVIRMFILIVTFFCICTLPYAILYATINFLLAYKRQDVNQEVIWTLNYSLFAFSNINSCLNPFIYAKRQAEVKKFVKKAWNKLCCKTRHIDMQTDRGKKCELSVSDSRLSKYQRPQNLQPTSM